MGIGSDTGIRTGGFQPVTKIIVAVGGRAVIGVNDLDEAIGDARDAGAPAAVARGLIVAVRAKDWIKEKPEALEGLQTTYLSFLEDAFDARKRRFRNFLSYERQWLDEVPSEDAHGRSLWGLGIAAATVKPVLAYHASLRKAPRVQAAVKFLKQAFLDNAGLFAVEAVFAAATLANEHARLETDKLDSDRFGVLYGADMLYCPGASHCAAMGPNQLWSAGDPRGFSAQASPALVVCL